MMTLDHIRYAARSCRVLFLISIGATAVGQWPVSALADDLHLCNQAHTEPDEGIPACTRLLGQQGVDTDIVLVNRARGWSKKGDLDSAIEDYTSAIQRNPKNEAALLNRGVVWHRKSDYDRAIRDFGLVLDIKRNHPVALMYRGVAQRDKG